MVSLRTRSSSDATSRDQSRVRCLGRPGLWLVMRDGGNLALARVQFGQNLKRCRREQGLRPRLREEAGGNCRG